MYVSFEKKKLILDLIFSLGEKLNLQLKKKYFKDLEKVLF